MSGDEGAGLAEMRRLVEEARGESEAEREAKYERLRALSEEKRREREAQKKRDAERWPQSLEAYPPPIEFPDPDIINSAARLIYACRIDLRAIRSLREMESDPREQELAELEEWASLQYDLAASRGMSVRRGASKGGKAKTGTSKADDIQRAKFLNELAQAKGPTYNARVQKAIMRSGWPFSLRAARRLGEQAGLK